MPNGSEVRSPGEIVGDLARDVGDMVRGEVRLARAEIAGKLKESGQAGGYFGGAAVCGLLAAACFTVTCIGLLALAMPVWLAALLMCLFLVCIGAALYYGGKQKLKGINPVPQRTVETLRDNLQWARHRTT